MRKTIKQLQGESDYWRIKFINEQQRAEAAEAKLAELEKQAPYGTLINTFLATDPRAIAEARKRGMPTVEVFTRAAPAINLAELVPEERPVPPFKTHQAGMSIGFNACRAAILRKIEEAG